MKDYKRTYKKTYKAFRILFFIVIGVVAVTVFGFVVMLLWNWLIPPLFNGPTVTFWQALGLLILSKILFGGFHKRGGRHGRWKDRWKRKMSQMTLEEREKFKDKFMNKWCRPGFEEETESIQNVQNQDNEVKNEENS